MMKPQPCDSPYAKPKVTPTWSLLGLLALACAITAILIASTSSNSL